MAARQSHKLKVGGSSPSSATKKEFFDILGMRKIEHSNSLQRFEQMTLESDAWYDSNSNDNATKHNAVSSSLATPYKTKVQGNEDTFHLIN